MVKKTIYYSAPVTHKTVPKRGAADVVKAAFDTEDNLARAPFQSVSEEQKPANIIPMHGLRMWQGILKYVAILFLYSGGLTFLQLLCAQEHREGCSWQTAGCGWCARSQPEFRLIRVSVVMGYLYFDHFILSSQLGFYITHLFIIHRNTHHDQPPLIQYPSCRRYLKVEQ